MIYINVPDNRAIVIGIHRLTCGFPYKMPVMWNFCSYCDVIMAIALEIWSKISCDILLNLLLELGFITMKCGKHMDYKLWPDNPNICRYVKQPKRNNPQLNAQWWLFPWKVFSTQQYLLDNWVIKNGNKHNQSHRQSGIRPFSTQPVISLSWRCFLRIRARSIQALDVVLFESRQFVCLWKIYTWPHTRPVNPEISY